MSLKEEIKKRMFSAMKSGNVVEKEILRVAMGEITANEGRQSRDLSIEEIEALLKKLIKSNREALGAGPSAESKAQLEQEIGILEEFLPKSMSVEETIAALDSMRDAIVAAKGMGPAMGLAMKEVKTKGLTVDSATVTAAVTQLRGE
jgi:uncharacterized protein YqeY